LTLLKLKIEKGFKKDIKRDKKSEKYSQLDFEILKDIIKKLQEKKPIDPIHDIHPLHRPFLGYEAIHIKSDWILVFKIEEPFLILVMLGTHSQVYEK
jgi:mRNA interferase YafQ